MRRLTKRVENLLASSQKFRDSDKEVLLAIWHEEGLYLDDNQRRAFMNCSTAESITRARRKLAPEYPASKPVEEERMKKFKDFRGWYA